MPQCAVHFHLVNNMYLSGCQSPSEDPVEINSGITGILVSAFCQAKEAKVNYIIFALYIDNSIKFVQCFLQQHLI